MAELIENAWNSIFPLPYKATAEGLLVAGGNLLPPTLLHAYCRGIFPWFNAGDPILWWCPNPRWTLIPENFHVSRRSARKIIRSDFKLTLNVAFEKVMENCSLPRAEEAGTWITEDMKTAYGILHNLGYALSVETWQGGKLAGGLYGVALNGVFFGESMFHHVNEASRAALTGLIAFMRQYDIKLLDCQQESPHMVKMGAKPMPRNEFLSILRQYAGWDNGALDMGRLPWKPRREKMIYDAERERWVEMV